MTKLLHSRSLYISIVTITVIAVSVLTFGTGKKAPEELITTVVEKGSVRQLVSVSGIAEAEQSAELAFPVTGIVSDVLVSEGDVVETGDILVTLDTRALTADRQDALASLSRAVAERDELLAGPSESERSVTSESVDLALEALESTQENEASKIAKITNVSRPCINTTYS